MKNDQKTSKKTKTIWIVIGAIFVVIVAISLFSGSIEHQVANDFEEQYNIAARQGDPIQKCVQAGFVSAAYLQAKDESNYNKWKQIEKSDCNKAGLQY